MPEISVIVPVFKVEKYLDKCVESIVNQTFGDFELFLVDDGSPDNCHEMCDSWAKKDGRIKVIHKENGGLSDARNVALDKITGKYICFIDSDDYVPADSLEAMYNSLKNNDADIAVGNMISFDENGAEKDFYVPFTEETVLCGDDVLKTLSQPCACNRLYKSSVFNDLRYPVGRLYEDVFIWHKVLSQVKTIVFTGRTNYYYYIRSDSIMHQEYNIRFTDIIDAIQERYEWLESIGQKELALDARLFVYSRVAVAYAHLDKNNPEHKKRLDEIDVIYNDCYKVLMKSKSVGLQQKIRLWLLKCFPKVHTRFFGKNMPLALG